MFDKIFFERYFDPALRQFAEGQGIPAPVVALHMDDGEVLYLQKILHRAETWISLRVSDGSGASTQILCPYFAIKQLRFHTDLRTSAGSAPSYQIPQG